MAILATNVVDGEPTDIERVPPSHFTGCCCGKTGICYNKRSTKILNDEGIVNSYNQLLTRVSKSELWESALERNAAIRTVDFGQRVCNACWLHDKAALSKEDGLPRYWEAILSPGLQNSLSPRKVCKLCAYRRGVLLEFADDVQFDPDPVKQKVPAHVMESVRFFLAKTYGFPGDFGTNH